MDNDQGPSDLSKKKQDAGIIRCKICSFYTYIKSHFEQHMRFHNGEKPHSCKICNMSFLHLTDLIIHEQIIHAEGHPSSSQQDGQSNTQSEKLNNGIERYTGERPHTCEICGQSFDSPYDLKNHMQSHNPLQEKKYRSDHCPYATNDKSDLKMHVMNPSGDNRYKCNKGIPCRSHLTDHERIDSGETPYKCRQCGKGFELKSNLTTHLRIHTGGRPYRCDICEKTFTHKGTLTTHLRIHTGERPYRCDICEKTFTRKSHLTTHLRIHTGERPYRCDICEKTFTEKKTLTNHLRTHTGERPYRCDICEKTFTVKQTLTNHLITHTREKRFQCDICNERFQTSSLLFAHITLHNHRSEGPFKCLDCEKTYKHKDHLAHHMRSHDVQGRNYRCPDCGKTFMSPNELAIHECGTSDDPKL